MKTLIVLSFPLLIALYSCDKPIYEADNEVLISCIYYDNDLQKTIPADSYYLRVERMKFNDPGNDLIYEYLYNDSVTTIEPVKFTADNNLNYGRYVILARKDSLSAITELIYKGGSTQINLVLEPEK